MIARCSILVVTVALAVAFVSAEEEQLQRCDDLMDGFHSLGSSNCSQYLLCVNKTAIIGECPEDLVWNDAVNQCAPITEVSGSCGSAEPLADNATSCEGKSKRLYRVDGRCDMYFSCKSSAIANMMSKCESGAAFDERVQLCRPSIVVDDCHPSPSAEWLSFCVNKPNGLYEHGDRCGRVLACIAYEAYEFRCPTEKPYWSTELGQCIEGTMDENNYCAWPVDPLVIAAPKMMDIDDKMTTAIDWMDTVNVTTAEPEITREPRDDRGGKKGDKDDKKDDRKDDRKDYDYRGRRRCPNYCYRYRSRDCYRHCPRHCC